MKIAFIGARGVIGKYSGIETYYEEVGSRLAQRGHEVTVYCRSYFTPDVPDYRGIHIKRLPTLRSKHLETIVHSFLSTCHALFNQYDIVQFHALGSSPLSIVPRLVGKQTVVSIQGLDGERTKWGKLAKRYLRTCEWASVHCPSAASVVSHQLVDYYAQQYRTCVTYIPNGVTPQSPIPPRLIKEFGLEHSDYILFVGRLSPEKGCHYLLDAFKKLETTYKLVFVGGATYADEYVSKLRHNENEHILFLGYQSGEILSELFSNAYIYILPSSIEGLSISLLEAMSYGKCVLASDIPENLELVKEHGFSFYASNTNHLAQSIQYLIEHPDLVESSGRSAKAHVELNYSWDMIAHETEELYKGLLRNRV